MINAAYFWTIIFCVMIGTLTIRASLILAAARIRMPERAREMFSFFPAAIFPAFIVPVAFFHQGHSELLFGKERLWVLFAAAVVCLWTRSTLATILFGLIALYGITTYL